MEDMQEKYRKEFENHIKDSEISDFRKEKQTHQQEPRELKQATLQQEKQQHEPQ